METYTIGQIAEQTAVGVETIRYYEREGLIPNPPRRSSGYREYTTRTIARLKFIKRAKELGFSLKEIAELLSLRVDPDTTCADVRQRSVEKLADVRERIRTLRRMEQALGKLVSSCQSSGPTAECPILEALGGTEL